MCEGIGIIWVKLIASEICTSIRAVMTIIFYMQNVMNHLSQLLYRHLVTLCLPKVLITALNCAIVRYNYSGIGKGALCYYLLYFALKCNQVKHHMPRYCTDVSQFTD